jgi:hypothetical protein
MVMGIHEGGNYGKYIKIAHAGGWVTLYAHLNAFAMLDVGDYVVGGQTIGFAGTTGNSTGTHLHFGLSHVTNTYTDADGNRWPKGIHDPTDYLKPFMATPPAPAGLDLLPYIKGDGTIYQMKVMWQGQEHSQQMQTQTTASEFYLVKNREWEQMWFADGHVMRGIDTSPGDGAYYAQFTSPGVLGARWCPAVWKPGDTYRRNPLVVWYDKLTGQQLSGPRYDAGYRETFLKFANHFSSWRHPKGGPTFSDVIELHWLLKLDGAAAEKYFYAKDYGLVGWESWNGDYSYVTEVFLPGERQPMSREEITTPWKK